MTGRGNSEKAETTQRSAVVVVLIVTIIVLAALLVTALTLPLLSRSVVAFAVVAGCCWLAIFAATFAVSRSLGRPTGVEDRSTGSEALAQRPEGILNHTLTDGSGLERVASGPAEAEERVD
jgi:hypothetical protein